MSYKVKKGCEGFRIIRNRSERLLGILNQSELKSLYDKGNPHIEKSKSRKKPKQSEGEEQPKANESTEE